MSWIGIQDKVLNQHDWTLSFHELFHDNRKKWKLMDLSMDLWHSNNAKVILLKFAKNHCFWTLWTLNNVDCIPFPCIDSFHMTQNQAKQFQKILFLNFRITWLNPHLCGKGPVKSVLFSCPSCLSDRDAFFPESTL